MSSQIQQKTQEKTEQISQQQSKQQNDNDPKSKQNQKDLKANSVEILQSNNANSSNLNNLNNPTNRNPTSNPTITNNNNNSKNQTINKQHSKSQQGQSDQSEIGDLNINEDKIQIKLTKQQELLHQIDSLHFYEENKTQLRLFIETLRLRGIIEQRQYTESIVSKDNLFDGPQWTEMKNKCFTSQQLRKVKGQKQLSNTLNNKDINQQDKDSESSGSQKKIESQEDQSIKLNQQKQTALVINSSAKVSNDSSPKHHNKQVKQQKHNKNHTKTKEKQPQILQFYKIQQKLKYNEQEYLKQNTHQQQTQLLSHLCF